MFPPLTIAATRSPSRSGTARVSTAAVAAAPPGSASSLALVSRSRIAATIDVVVDHHDVVDVATHDLEREIARHRRGETVGDRADGVERDRAASVEAATHRRGARRLDAVDANLRVRLFDRDEHSADQPTAADRHDHRVEVRCLLEQLEPRRALPRHDVLVVERMREDRPRSRSSSRAFASASMPFAPCSTTSAP